METNLPEKLREAIYAEGQVQEAALRNVLAKLETFDTFAHELNVAWNKLNNLTGDLNLLSDTTMNLLPNALAIQLGSIHAQRETLLVVQRAIENVYTTYKAHKAQL